MTQLGMSSRSYHRILKLARTIADLEGAPNIAAHHLAEAIQYRLHRSSDQESVVAVFGRERSFC